MVFGAFVTLAAVAAIPAPAAPAASPAGASPRAPIRVRAQRLGNAGPDPASAYSLRARRRFAAFLRMRLLELRESGLERAAEVIERRLPVESLLPRR